MRPATRRWPATSRCGPYRPGPSAAGSTSTSPPSRHPAPLVGRVRGLARRPGHLGCGGAGCRGGRHLGRADRRRGTAAGRDHAGAGGRVRCPPAASLRKAAAAGNGAEPARRGPAVQGQVHRFSAGTPFSGARHSCTPGGARPPPGGVVAFGLRRDHGGHGHQRVLPAVPAAGPGSADVGSRPEPRRDGRAPSAWRSRGYAAGVSFGAAPARLWSGRQWATSRAITARGAGNLRAARKKHLPVWLTAAGPYGRCMPETHVAAPQWAKPFARSRYTGCRAREAARESLARVAARTCKFGPPGAHQAGDDPAARELPA